MCAWVCGWTLVAMSTSTPNSDQRAAWNGSDGDHWAEASSTGSPDDGLVLPLLDAAAIAGGDRVLDVGCGTGEMTLLAAQRAGGPAAGHAVGVDLSAHMVEVATAAAAAAGVANARFEAGDAQVHPFPPAAFDVAVSHFGIMFFDDPVAAFANVGRALRPGGRLAVVCPQAAERCEWYTVPLAGLLGHRPSAGEAPSLMFSLAEAGVVQDVLARAGFADVRLEARAAALRFGSDLAAAVRFYAGSGPVRAQVERRPELGDRVVPLLERALAPYVGADGVRIPGEHWIVTARAGG